MPIDAAEVRRIAELARLEIADEAIERVAGELSKVLAFVEELQRSADSGALEPTTFAPAEAPLRPDELDPRRLGAETAMAAAPESEDGFFLVPPVVENLES